jgi:hypothetical protein
MRTIWWVVGGIVVVLVVIGLITYSSGSDSREAQRKAQELTQRFEEAGLRVPQSQDILTRSLGTDGGAVCDNPLNALGKATLLSSLTNGASFVGQRPVIVDRRILQGELLILDTYCPDKLAPYKDRIEQLKTDDVLKA